MAGRRGRGAGVDNAARAAIHNLHATAALKLGMQQPWRIFGCTEGLPLSPVIDLPARSDLVSLKNEDVSTPACWSCDSANQPSPLRRAPPGFAFTYGRLPAAGIALPQWHMVHNQQPQDGVSSRTPPTLCVISHDQKTAHDRQRFVF